MKWLLDEHISPAVARGLSGVVEVAPLRDWQAGAYLEAPDTIILQAAAVDGWSLVTFDLRTIPLLLKDWGEQGITHGGVILVDEHTIAQNDIGGLVRALTRLIAATVADATWQNRTVLLSR